MLTPTLLTSLRTVGQCLRHPLRRHIATSSVLAQKDPIQDLFLQKLREFDAMMKSGKITDVPAEALKDLDIEMNRLDRMYNPKNENMLAFPEFKWSDQGVKIDNIVEKDPATVTKDDLPL